MSGLSYLFERFPSFTQTFCFREVLELRKRGVEAPVYSIRLPADEPDQDYPPELAEVTTYLPTSFDESLTSPAFRRRSRQAIKTMVAQWGDDSEKRRIYEALWLLPKLDEKGIRHVHVHFAGIAARTAFWLRRLGGVRYSFTAHANDIFCDEPPARLGTLIRDAEFVSTVSDFSRDLLARQFPDHAQKIHRVYNGIHLDRFRTSHPNPTTPLILSVGRYIEKKGFADLISALANVRDLPWQCKIIGQGPLESTLRAQAQDLGLTDRVDITGPMSEGRIADLLAETSIFALPCVNASDGGKDNLPTVIMEAMAASVPVISTRVAGVPEMVLDGRTGLLSEERDPAALAVHLRKLLAEPNLAADMGRAGRELCEDRFATAATTAQLHGLFEQHGALENRRRTWWQNIFQRL